MKELFLITLALASISSMAMTINEMELVKLSRESVNIADTSMNLDKSVTFRDIHILRGDQRYSIDAYRTSFDSVCKMLGYERSLSGAELNTSKHDPYAKWTLAALTSDGKFNGTFISTSYVTKVTCYNTNELKPVVDFSMSNNPDGSVMITDVSYLRGDQEYSFDADKTSYEAVCKVVGYEKALSGANLNTYKHDPYARWTLAALSIEGNYIGTFISTSYITKVTCYAGSEPDFVIMVGGNRYRRQISTH